MTDEVTITIDTRVVERFPDVLVGGFVAAGLQHAAPNIDAAQALTSAQRSLTVRGLTAPTLPQEPEIQDWRAAMRDCGLKPSEYRCSAEQLARRVLGGRLTFTNDPVVDLYCAVSATHLAPLGAYDVDYLPAREITLRPADPASDRFEPIVSTKASLRLDSDVIVYASVSTVLCWAFNYRDSATTAVRASTDTAVFIGEGVSRRQHLPLQNALSQLAHALTEAGATVGPPTFAIGSASPVMGAARLTSDTDEFKRPQAVAQRVGGSERDSS